MGGCVKSTAGQQLLPYQGVLVSKRLCIGGVGYTPRVAREIVNCPGYLECGHWFVRNVPEHANQIRHGRGRILIEGRGHILDWCWSRTVSHEMDFGSLGSLL